MSIADALTWALVVLNGVAGIAYLISGDWRLATYFTSGAFLVFSAAVWK